MNNGLEEAPGDIEPTYYGFLTELNYETVVLNNQTRRGFLIFNLDKRTKPEDYALVSNIFKNLHLKIDKTENFNMCNLLAEKTTYEEDSSFSDTLQEITSKLSQIREAEGFVKPGSMRASYVSLDGKSDIGIHINPPPAVSKSAESYSKIKDLKTLKQRMQIIKIIPSNMDAWSSTYPPQAIFTQKWATENDMAYAAWLVLNKAGLKTERVKLNLSENGKKAIRRFFSPYKCTLYELPAIKYNDDNGKTHTVVFPLFKDKTEIQSYFKKEEEADVSYPYVSIEVSITAEKLSSATAQTASEMASALAAGESSKTETITLLNEKYPLKDLSLGFVSLGFVKVFDNSKGLMIKAIIDSPLGRKVSDEGIDPRMYKPVRINFTFYAPDKDYKTVRVIGQNRSLEDYFFVMGINTPDMPKNSIKQLQNRWISIYKNTPKTDTISALRWFAAGTILRFVSAQTAYEKTIAKKLNLRLKRVSKPRIILITATATQNSKKPIASIDLVSFYPKVEGKEEAIKSFNILAGFYYTDLEKYALPNGYNALDILRVMPKDTRLLFISPDDNSLLAEALKNSGYPNWIVEHFKNSQNYVLFPSKPLKFNKFYKTAWLEIDENYKIFSYMDSGEKGGLTEHIIANDEIAQLADYMVGFWMGVQSSVWSVAGFSLILGDWKQIKTQAHAFARQLSDYLVAVLESKERMTPNAEKLKKVLIDKDISGALGLNEMQYGGFSEEKLKKDIQKDAEARGFSSDDVKDIIKEKDIKKMFDKTRGKFKEKYLGFTNGFKDGVDYYFK